MKPPFAIYVSLVLLLVLNTAPVSGLEPVSTGIAAGVAIVTSAFFAGYDTVMCKFTECCDNKWFKPNITGLQHDLLTKLHGQHVVNEAVIRSIAGHVKFSNPEKALVLSFHGTTGSGKNFVSRIIAENLYSRGMDSQYVHLFHAPSHFPHESMVPVYQDQLRTWIRGNVTKCGHHLFIFDEVDKMPAGLISAIKPFLDHYPKIDGVDYRKNVFIFLSNTGGVEISAFVFEHWRQGLAREELRFKDLETTLTRSAFNDKGGLWHSSLIDHNLVSAFIPFLPLERKHVKQCIRDDLRQKNIPDVQKEFVDRVAEEMQYFPASEQLFSKTGCKRVSEKVNYHLMYNEL